MLHLHPRRIRLGNRYLEEVIKERARMAGWVKRIFREPVSIATYLTSVAPARISVAKKPLCWNLMENAVTQESTTISSGQRFVGMPDRGQPVETSGCRGTHHQ